MWASVSPRSFWITSVVAGVHRDRAEPGMIELESLGGVHAAHERPHQLAAARPRARMRAPRRSTPGDSRSQLVEPPMRLHHHQMQRCLAGALGRHTAGRCRLRQPSPSARQRAGDSLQAPLRDLAAAATPAAGSGASICATSATARLTRCSAPGTRYRPVILANAVGDDAVQRAVGDAAGEPLVPQSRRRRPHPPAAAARRLQQSEQVLDALVGHQRPRDELREQQLAPRPAARSPGPWP